MGIKTSELAIVVRAKDRASKTYSTLQRKTDKFVASVKRRFVSLKRAVFSLKSAFVSFAAVAFARSTLKAYERQERALISMETTMRSMGRFTPELSQQLQDLATNIQKVGISGDEAVMEGQAILVTYKEISDKLLPKATKVMANIAAKMGGEEGGMANAANMVGKAAIGMTGELRRAGITIDDAVAKSGDFSLILDAIQTQIGDQQRMMRLSGFGGIKGFAMAVGDLKEKIGETFAKVLSPTLEVLRTHIEKLNGPGDAGVRLLQEGIIFVARAAEFLAKGVDAVRGAFLIMKTVGARVLAFVATQFATVLEQITSDLEFLTTNPVFKWLVGKETAANFTINMDRAARDVEAFAERMGAAADKAAGQYEKLMDPTRMRLGERIGVIADELEGRFKQKGFTEAVVPIDKILTGAPAKVDATTQAVKKMKDELAGVRSVVATIGGVFTNSVVRAVGQAIDGTFKWRDALKGLLKDLALALTRMVMMKLVGAVVGGIGGAATDLAWRSMPASQGSSVSYAKGGFWGLPSAAKGTIFDQPGIYRGTGVADNPSGIEAALPLERDADGVLGVRVIGGGGGVTVNITDPSPEVIRQILMGDTSIVMGSYAQGRQEYPGFA